MLGSASHEPGASDGTDWPDNRARLGATGLWLQIPTANHGSFTDQLMFLDRHLRGRAAPLLDGPVAEYPEVEFQDG
ncbi:hypothetical protein [Promicromonospora sp. NPDC023805]|uniref:hypothetical protein n=1 Tax=Promicromonospora sp. NPDC023805 TaxID=3154696 RepID=UPI0033E085E8